MKSANETFRDWDDDREQQCGNCDYIGPLNDFDCGGLPDGMCFCPKCLDIIEVGSGASVDCDDIELATHELTSE